MIKLLILLIVLLVNTMIINYINGIEKDNCDCSSNFSTRFVKYYSLITIILTLFIIFNKEKQIQKLLDIYVIVGILNIYLLFKVFQDIKKNSCVCKKKWGFNLIYFYSMIIMIVYLLSSTILFMNDIFY